MSEAEFNIDAAQEQYEQARGGVSDDGPVDDPALDPDAIAVDEIEGDDLPPGFKSYEDYVADGGDPARYRGSQAFSDEHDRIEENKRLRKEIKGLNTTVQQTMDAVTDWQTQERTKIRKELEADLNTAKEAEDVDGAIAAQQELDKHDATPAAAAEPAEAQHEEHGAIMDFREANPLIDQGSDQFNAEFNADVEAFYNATAEQLSMNGRRQLTDKQIQRCLGKAMKEARDLHADLFESPRNNRQDGKQTRGKRRQGARDPAPKAENYVINNPRNPSQRNAASDVRDSIIKAAEKAASKAGKSPEDQTKAGKEAGERFERSLHA